MHAADISAAWTDRRRNAAMRRLQDVQPTYLQTHLVQLKVCPEAIRAKYIQNVAKGKTAEKRSGNSRTVLSGTLRRTEI